MAEQGGFSIELKNEKVAEQAGISVKEFLRNTPSGNWLENYYQNSDSVSVFNESIITFEEFNGIFPILCNYIEKSLPGAIIKGQAHFWNTTTDFIIEETVTRDDRGTLDFRKRIEDWDTVSDLYEMGMSVEEIADITGMSIDDIQKYYDGAEEDE